VLKRWLWLGLLSVLLGGIWIFVQTPESSSAQPPELAPWLYGPEIWRLPPTGGTLAIPAEPPSTTGTSISLPPALVLPQNGFASFSSQPGEIEPPVANSPCKLSDILDQGAKFGMSASDDPPKKLWDGNFTLGLGGSEGNSETFDLQFGFHANRKTESNALTLGVDYNKQTSKTVTTAHRLFFEGRFELLTDVSRWSFFVHQTIEYDEFDKFDVLDATDIGMGYQLIKTETTTFVGRFGFGFSHQYGGPDDGRYVPEAVFGLQFERQLNKRQKFVGTVEYAPDVTFFERYRVRSQAAWDILLDQERNLSMRLGVLNRYNSLSDGARPNDLDYALMLMWKF